MLKLFYFLFFLILLKFYGGFIEAESQFCRSFLNIGGRFRKFSRNSLEISKIIIQSDDQLNFFFKQNKLHFCENFQNK